MLYKKLLLQYINIFIGYGNPEAKYWFIGMEHGGGNDDGEIKKRLNVWEERGKRQFENILDYL